MFDVHLVVVLAGSVQRYSMLFYSWVYDQKRMFELVQVIFINPFTPKICLLILLSSCYT